MVKVLLVSFLTKHYPATEWSQKMKLEPPTALQPIAVATTSSIIISVFFGVLAENYRFGSAKSTKFGTRMEKYASSSTQRCLIRMIKAYQRVFASMYLHLISDYILILEVAS